MAISKITGSGLGTINSPVEFTSADNLTQLTITSTDADANTGPKLDLIRNSASPAANDILANIRFMGADSAGNSLSYIGIFGQLIDPTDGSEDGSLEVDVRLAGTNRSRIISNATETVFNDDSVDLDFRVESNDNANMLFVDGGNNRVTVAGLPITGEASAGRNMIINGAMNVSQRGTTTGTGGVGGTAAHYPTLDRWQIEASGAGRATMSQTSDGPNGISANCIKLDCTTADTDIAAGELFLLEQRIEGQNLQRIGKGVAGAKQVTISFYVKASASFTFALEFVEVQHGRSCSKLFDVTTDWNRIELTFPADVDDGSSPIVDDNAAGVRLFFWLHGGATFTSGTLQSGSFANQVSANRAAGIDSFFSNTANNFFITGVQMEVGPVATEFEQEDFGTTLAKCKRYFERKEWGASSMDPCIQNTVSSGTYSVYFDTKRAAPTVITLPTPTRTSDQANGISLLTSGGAYRGSSGSEAVTAARQCKTNVRIQLTGFANSGAVGDATWAFYQTNTSSPVVDPHIDFDSEL